MAREAVHDLISRSAPAAIGMSCPVSNAEICLGLDDHSRYTSALFVGNDEQLAQQVAGDGEGVFAQIE